MKSMQIPTPDIQLTNIQAANMGLDMESNEEPINILIVEDELLIARDVSRKLKRRGYNVTNIVSSSKAALDEVARQQPDLVLMDIVIKGSKDGIATAAEIHEKYNLPVVFVTAYADENTLDRAEQAGSYGYVVKPFKERELHATIKMALKKHKQYETLQIQSIRDPLTHLFNRRYFDESLMKEFVKAERHDRPLSVVMVDVDHFKQFNDTYGHDAGDRVLQVTAAFLQNGIRRSDIVCRYGGEEMILILPETTPEQAYEIAESLREGIAELAVVHNAEPLAAITVSIGVAGFPQHGLTPTVVVKTADEALYQAKTNGRNQVMVAPYVLPTQSVLKPSSTGPDQGYSTNIPSPLLGMAC